MNRPRLHWTSKLYLSARYYWGVDAQTNNSYDNALLRSSDPIVLQPSITSRVDDTPLGSHDEYLPIHPNHSRQSSLSSHLSSDELDALSSPFDSRLSLDESEYAPLIIDNPSNYPLRERSPIPTAKSLPCSERQILSNHSSVYRNDIEIQQQIDSDSEFDDLPDSKEELEDIYSDISDGLIAPMEDEEKGLYTLKAMPHSKSQPLSPRHQSIPNLLDTPLSAQAQAILGNPSTYSIHTSGSELFHLERDIRKIKTSLEDIEVDLLREYAKMVILKHYDLLVTIYKKYCKIGGDMDSLTMKGWMAMLRDARLIGGDGDEDRQRFVDLFYRIHNDHHSKSDAQSPSGHKVQLSGLYGADNFRDDDPWTGLWVTEDERHRMKELEQKKHSDVPMTHLQRGYSSRSGSSGCSFDSNDSFHRFKSFKIRKVGDRRIVGCINNRNYALIRGSLMKNNFKKSRLDIRFKRRNNAKRLQSKRVLKCLLNALTESHDVLTMKVKWEQSNEGSSTTKQGQLKLFKVSGLNEDDEDLPNSHFMGLSRYEFFDAILSLSQVIVASSTTSTCNDLYALCDQLVVEYLDPYIYRNTMIVREHIKGKEMSKCVMRQMRLCNSVLVRLFQKYKSLDNVDNIHLDQWIAMAMDLCSVAAIHDRNVWSKGGRPTMDDMVSCFSLSKGVKELHVDEIEFHNFMRVLVYFAGAVYPNEPNTQYAEMPFESKLDLVLKWCVKLDRQKGKISSNGYIRSESFRGIKRQNSIQIKNSMTGSSGLWDDEPLLMSTRRVSSEKK